MAANNTDSKRIFDLYVNRYLTEVARSEETSEPGKGVEAAKQERAKDITSASDQGGSKQYAQPGGGYGGAPVADATAGTTPTAAQTDADNFRAVGDPETAAQTDADNFRAVGDPEAATVAKPATEPGAGAPKAANASAPDLQTAVKTGTPDDAEKTLLKQLHASDYNPNSSADQKRLQELRTAQTALKQKLGRDPSLKELSTVSYAQQYGEKSPYYQQAQKMGVDLGKPGQPTGGTAVVPAQSAPAASTPATPAASTTAPAQGVNVMKPGQAAQPSQQETLARIKQSLGSQGIDVSDNNKLYGIAKGLGIIQ